MTVLINPHRFAAAVAPYADAYLGQQVINTTPTGSVYTFSDVSIGTADSRRQIILAICTNAGTGATHTTLTANSGAISFTRHVSSSGANSNTSSIWQANVPTGTTLTAPIFTPSAASARATLHAWAHGRGALVGTPIGATTTGTIDVPANGLVIYHSTCTNSSACDAPWTGVTGLTEDYDSLQAVTLYNSGGRYVNDSVADTAKTFAPAWTAAGGNVRLVAAAWGAQL